MVANEVLEFINQCFQGDKSFGNPAKSLFPLIFVPVRSDLGGLENLRWYFMEKKEEESVLYAIG